MQRNNYYAKNIEVPDNLRELLLQTPKQVSKQKREFTIWITVIFLLVSFNIGLYLQQETKQQEHATADVYQYLTQTSYYP